MKPEFTTIHQNSNKQVWSGGKKEKEHQCRRKQAAITQAKLEKIHWEQLEHPPYSPPYRRATTICLDR
ncbi:hypothetical protein NQ318_023077 [Aromia moschata]|uniref:Uncharacterized protein n=1 Tax=Aromia moschata TaxID=1265417 RepID=A0AAV8XKN5_9CUCU|nr:hypothetical protein NQ318_023077 [Aromia moschata]